jgi:parvulin-like peptidyl-prolyl isomerase
MIPRSRHFFYPLALLAVAASARAADDSAPAAPAASAPAAVDELKQDKFTDSVAASVNGKVITLSQLDKQIEPLVQEIFQEVDAKYGDDPVKAKEVFGQRVNELGVNVLKSMVDRVLIIQEFTGKGYKVPASYLERQFEDKMTTDFHDDRASFLKFLADQGISELEFRKNIEEDDMVGYMVDQMRGSVTGISPDRIKTYYEKNKQDFFVQASVKVRQITLKPVADAPIAEQAAKIVQEARQPGANFVELAQKYSSDPAARSGNVPDLTFTSQDKLTPEVRDAVFKLKPDEVSDPVTIHDAKTGETVIFIFKCDEQTAEGYRPLADIRTQIEGILGKQDDDQALEKWLQRLRDKAYIKYGLGSGS